MRFNPLAAATLARAWMTSALLLDIRRIARIHRLATVATLVFCASAHAEDEQARIARLQKLSVTEQEELRQQREKFESLAPDEQQRMRQLHTAIATNPDSDRLRNVMLQYHEWLKSLTGQERADLLKLPADERVEAIKQLMEQQRQQRFRDIVKTLAPEDSRIIFTWLDHYTANHQEELIDLLPERIRGPMRDRFAQTDAQAQMTRMRLMMALGSQDSDVQWPAPTDEEIQQLNSQLSDKAKAALDAKTSREQKLQLVRQWVRAAVASRMTPQVSRERLMSFYRDYRQQAKDTQQKKQIEELDSLAPEEFYQEVSKIYFRSREHWRGRPDWNRGGDRGDGHRGDRDRPRDDDHRRGPGPPPPHGDRPRPNSDNP